MGLQQEISWLLSDTNERGGYLESLVCTDDGLLVASSGPQPLGGDDLAAFASLFDTVVLRACRDLGLGGVDELSLLDDAGMRMVIRPISVAKLRMFLVVRMPRRASWRRNTTRAAEQLAVLLEPLSQQEPAHGE